MDTPTHRRRPILSIQLKMWGVEAGLHWTAASGSSQEKSKWEAVRYHVAQTTSVGRRRRATFKLSHIENKLVEPTPGAQRGRGILICVWLWACLIMKSICQEESAYSAWTYYKEVLKFWRCCNHTGRAETARINVGESCMLGNKSQSYLKNVSLMD